MGGRSAFRAVIAAAGLLSISGFAASPEAAQSLAPLLLSLGAILVAAKIGGETAVRAGQPAVLGELVAGIALGNAPLAGIHLFEPLATNPTIALLAQLGVLLLLFEVGLKSTIAEMLRVGPSALAVATLGVVTPFLLGWLAASWLLPEASGYAHAFVGATLCATSVGITARVLQDLGCSETPEARVILGAAVIDDVLGLIVLAVVSGAIAAGGAGVSVRAIAGTAGKASVFLIGSLAIGAWLAPRTFALAATLRARGVLLSIGLVFCFWLAWLASRIQLAPIVGAFAAGLILEDVHYRDFVRRGESPLEDLVGPIADFLAPVFFVLMGMRTNLHTIVEPRPVAIAAVLTVVAIAGKQACSLGVFTPGANRWTVGLGMIPRGEVGLIFANVGTELTVNGAPVIDPTVFSAVVLMVVITTLITPPALRWSFARDLQRRGSA